MKHITLLMIAAAVAAKSVTLSNVALPKDTNGNLMQTGETTVLKYGGNYYYYANVWYEANSTVACAGVDCCGSSGGCAACCFNPPSSKYPDTCVYAPGHQVLVYSTPDFETWTYLGVALPLSNRLPGIEFRPQVVFSPIRNQFVMWYEDRWSGQSGYAVAVSDTPQGPFTTLSNSVIMPGPGRIGDYDIFIDDDGTAYHVRTGVTIVKLSPDYTSATNEYYAWTDGSVEGPAFFKRNGTYYITLGPGCCACRGGSDIIVYRASSPLGPYTLQGSVGRNVSNVFDAHTPYNYATHAQQTKVIPYDDDAGYTSYLWLGNQWVTSQQPGAPRNYDLLYWTVLNFTADGNITQVTWSETTTINISA